MDLQKSASMPVRRAAKIMGVTPRFIHMGLRSGKLPFGVAIQYPGSSKWTYYVNETRFWAYMQAQDMGNAQTLTV